MSDLVVTGIIAVSFLVVSAIGLTLCCKNAASLDKNNASSTQPIAVSETVPMQNMHNRLVSAPFHIQPMQQQQQGYNNNNLYYTTPNHQYYYIPQQEQVYDIYSTQETASTV